VRLAESWQLLALGSACCAAFAAVFGKVGVENIPPDVATFVRTLVLLALIGLLVTSLGQWNWLTQISGRGWLFLSLSALGGAGSWFFYFRALKIADVSRVQPIDKMSLVLVALFGVFFLGERLSPANWAGVGLMTGGLLLVSMK
jgi:bacterial/archaeal transporter family protein